jgi:hypothetical protein
VVQCLDPRERGPGSMGLPKSEARPKIFDTATNLFPTLFSRIAFVITGCFRRPRDHEEKQDHISETLVIDIAYVTIQAKGITTKSYVLSPVTLFSPT